MRKITNGRDLMNEFAPKFAELNDDILFGEIWSRSKELSHRDRSLVTISALVGMGILDAPLVNHIRLGKENGITETEIAEVLTQLAFYAGWPNAWAALKIAKNEYKNNQASAVGTTSHICDDTHVPRHPNNG